MRRNRPGNRGNGIVFLYYIYILSFWQEKDFFDMVIALYEKIGWFEEGDIWGDEHSWDRDGDRRYMKEKHFYFPPKWMLRT